MTCDCFKQGRKGTTITVIILGGALFTILLSYLVFGKPNDYEDIPSLQMVAIIFRHGDRSPTELYPNDPNLNYPWPGGLGALSEKGSYQMYSLGNNMKKRYNRLLPLNGLYSKNQMYIRSSAAERCIMSAQSFLAGFIPPLESHNPLPISWQPVAINSLSRKEDYLLAQKKPCDKYDEILKLLYSSPNNEIQEINEKNKYLYEVLTKNSGKNITNILDIELLYNTLEIEKNAGLKLPDWTKGIFPEKMLPLAERNLALLTETPFMLKVKGGAIITDVIDNMGKKINGLLLPDRSIYIYSGHDVTLVNLMRALDVISQTSNKPEYSSAIVFELHQSNIITNDSEVKIFYYFNEENKSPKQLIIPNCNSPCSLTNFMQSVSSVILRDYDDICKL